MLIDDRRRAEDLAPSVHVSRVWITGAGGLIGHALVNAAGAGLADRHVYGTTRHDVDLSDADAVRRAFETIRPDVVIHCAAMTKTPACELDPGQARFVNVEITKRLADLARDISLIFFSTDLVFDGNHGWYDEAAAVNPLSVYAETKVEAERLVLANPNHTVIRTSLTGGTSPTWDRGFNEELRRAWQAGRTLHLFTDEFRCPIHAAVSAQAVWELVARNDTGLFHLAGAERLSRWQIGQLIAQRWPQLTPRLEPASRSSYTGPPRPADTSLNCAKVQQRLSFSLPGLTDWLNNHPTEIF